MSGTLTAVPVERGQQVGPGTNLARVANPSNLKAELRIAETQTKDIHIGQYAEVDTRNGVVKGHVSRIDPSATGGTVGVDVIMDGALPPGARPDLSVDGTIQLEKLDNIIFVGRPAFGQENSTVTIFKVQPNGEAHRHEGEARTRSVNTIEVLEGLQPGDQVILSDMSQFDAFDRRTARRANVTRSHMNTSAQSLIQLDGVTKVFFTDEVETHALAGIHLEIKSGEYIAIAGPSGCGKSTLLSILGPARHADRRHATC